jgi:hypothetical protein
MNNDANQGYSVQVLPALILLDYSPPADIIVPFLSAQQSLQ